MVGSAQEDRWGANLRGFTLIELLVVVAIIALLVMVLTPSLYQARELAWKAMCLSNLHNVELSCAVYFGAQSGFTPPSRGDGWAGAGTSIHDPRWVRWGKTSGYYGGFYAQGNTWADLLFWHGALPDPQVLTCPVRSWTDAEVGQLKGYAEAGDPKITGRVPQSFGMNAKVDGVRLSTIASPAARVLFAPNIRCQPTIKVGRADYEDYNPDAARHADYSAGYIFCDGHAENYAYSRIYGMDYDPSLQYKQQLPYANLSMW